MRDKSDAVPSFNDTPSGAGYVWELIGFPSPSGNPLDNVASTQRNDSLLKMDQGQRIDVDGLYLNMEWDLGGHTLFAVAGQRDQDEHLPNTYTGAAPINSITGEPLSLFDASRDTTRETTQFEVRLASNSDGPLNYVVGAFQQTNDARFCVVQLLGFVDIVIGLIQKEVKNRRESIEDAKKANRPDLISENEDEIKVLEVFLPKAMPDEELRAIVQAAIAETGASTPADMGKVMKIVMGKVAGKAPNDKISSTVRELLQK
jgi:hypothetical protein